MAPAAGSPHGPSAVSVRRILPPTPPGPRGGRFPRSGRQLGSYLACTHGRLATGGCARKQFAPQWRRHTTTASIRERRVIVRHIRTESGREWAAYLESAGLTQAELARRSGLAESMVSRWLRGLNQPDVPNLRRVRPVLGVPMLELIVAAGYLSLEEAELQDAPEPPAPVQLGISTDGLTPDQIRQLDDFVTFLRAQNGPRLVEAVPDEPAEPLRYAAYGGAKLSREQQARVREQARLAREEAARSGRQVVFLDDPGDQRR
jgi:transcriptional regulator with XRE-family HTH domain